MQTLCLKRFKAVVDSLLTELSTDSVDSFKVSRNEFRTKKSYP